VDEHLHADGQGVLVDVEARVVIRVGDALLFVLRALCQSRAQKAKFAARPILSTPLHPHRVPTAT
jgi:hypothetical protein